MSASLPESRNTPRTRAQHKPGTDASIRKLISKASPGKVFSAADFAHLGSRAAVDKALSRLRNEGKLRRLARGIYDVPREHDIFGILEPEASTIAQSIERKSAVRLQPSGAYAANLLGLSEQVPLKPSFLTDGPSRTVIVGHLALVLKHTTPKNMATAGRISGLVIQALRHLKKENIGPDMIASLKRRLTREDKAVLKRDYPLAPVWIGNIMRELAEDDK